MAKNTAHRIRLRNLDDEVRNLLTGVTGLSKEDFSKLMASYFNKDTDTVTKDIVDPAVFTEISEEEDIKDQLVKDWVESGFRKKETLINKNDLTVDFRNEIANALLAANAAVEASKITDDEGNVKYDLEIASQNDAQLAAEVEGIKNSLGLLTNAPDLLEYQTNEIDKLSKKVSTLDDTVTDLLLKAIKKKKDGSIDYEIKKADLSAELLDELNKFPILEAAIDSLRSSSQSESGSGATAVRQITSVREIVAANHSLLLQTNTPYNFDAKIYILDDEEGSPQYGKYINSEGVIISAFMDKSTAKNDAEFKSIASEANEQLQALNEEEIAKTKEAATDEEKRAISEEYAKKREQIEGYMTSQQDAYLKEICGIYLYNTSDKDVTVKLVYDVQENDEKFKSNVDEDRLLPRAGTIYMDDSNYTSGPTVLTDSRYIMSQIYPSTYLTMTSLNRTFDISQLTTLQRIFSECESLEEIPGTNDWDVSKIRSLQRSFNGCKKLKKIEVSSWNTSNVVNYSRTFDRCETVEEIDISGWQTSKGTNFSECFNGCKSLKKIIGTIDLSSVVGDVEASLKNMLAGTMVTSINIRMGTSTVSKNLITASLLKGEGSTLEINFVD